MRENGSPTKAAFKKPICAAEAIQTKIPFDIPPRVADWLRTLAQEPRRAFAVAGRSSWLDGIGLLGAAPMRIAILAFAMLLVAGCAHTSGTRVHPLNARFKSAWPGKSDVEWFCAAKWKSVASVLKEYGSPKEQKSMPDGTVRWRYPWLAIAELRVKDGIVVGAFYDAGY